MKAKIIIFFILGLALTVTVKEENQCSACKELKSQLDCENKNHNLKCQWQDDTCVSLIDTYKSYCEQIEDPATKCSSTFGCAYVDNKCTHFTGCTAYVRTSLKECQEISIRCISNGITCADGLDCSKYTTDTCESSPSLKSPFKCKLENEKCRNYKCSDSDDSLTTDSQCNNWLSGCVTKGVGCIDKRLPCSKYTGSLDTCNHMIGADGKCTFYSTTSDSCKARTCSEAQLSTWDNSSCGEYKSGCKSTGFSCVETYVSCTKYDGDATSCLNYIGQEGYCAGDLQSSKCRVRICSDAQLQTWNDASCSKYKSGCKSTGFSCVETYVSCTNYDGDATSCLNYKGLEGYCAGGDVSSSKCKARQCEDKLSNVLKECQKYLSGCITNGFQCVSQLQNCDKYSGTISTCRNITGLDGKCKGTSESEDKPCSLRDCIKDSLGTETTNIDCEAVQFECKTTGAGCVDVLQSCSTYNDNGNCLSMIGSDGKCLKGVGEANTKCKPKQCSDIKTATTNEECKDYKSECVTNGAGCVNEIECEKTILMDSCQGTNFNYKCGWSGKCVNKQCSSQITESECYNTKISLEQPCIWKTSLCQNAICSDYISTDNTICDSYMKGCVTNGVKCANPNNCNEFQGTITTCRQYKASCTNTSDSIAATINCIPKTCGDSNITVNSDSDCESYLTGCLFAGSNKCLANSKDCTYYTGNSTDQCKIFTGYLTSTTRSVCWWVSGTNCTNKLCTQATGMTNDSDCGTFLSGCVFDGKNSCVLASAGCSSFKYNTNASDCRNLKGINNTQPCYDGLSGNCKKRECSDSPNTNDTDIKCESFLTGCLSNGSGCYDSTISCANLTGTSSQCSIMKGNSIPCLRKQACKSVTFSSCAVKQDAVSNQDCQAYSSTCVLTYGTTNCQTTQAACTEYSLSNTSTLDKSIYCNQVKTTSGTYCAYDPSTANTCVSRQCSLWNNQIGVNCSNYVSTSACSLANSNYCYTPSTCESYTIPLGTSNKLTWCNNIKNSSNKYCSYDSSVSATNCKTINKCEEAIAPTSIDECFIQTGQGCFFIGSTCVSIKINCSSYDISQIIEANRTSVCSKLKQNDNGIFKACVYVSGTVCDAQSVPEILYCEDILNPNRQRNCDYLFNCKYYASKCYTIKSCASYTFPANVSTDSEKLLFCQNMKNTGGTDFCSFTNGASSCNVPKSCSEYSGLTAMTASGSQNLSFCVTKRDKTGAVCKYINNATACSVATDSDACSFVPGTISNSIDCDLRTVPNYCYPYNYKCAQKSSCSTFVRVSIAECQQETGLDGYYCSYSSGYYCENGPTSCSSHSRNSLDDCSVLRNKFGYSCTWISGTTCSDPITTRPINSQFDCDPTGTSSYFNASVCIAKQLTCTSYKFPSSVSADSQREKYCKGLQDQSGLKCTYTYYPTCVSGATCNTHLALGVSDVDKNTYCSKLITNDNYQCVYVSGINCYEKADLCTNYIGMTAATIITQCSKLTDRLSRVCTAVSAATKCSYPLCSSITSPTSQNDCDAKAPGCLYSSNKCVTPGLCSSYSTGSAGAIAFCAGLKDTSGIQCYASTNSDSSCKTRACNDPATSLFKTHQDCKNYSSKCKFNGQSCVDITEPCSTYKGNSSSCSQYLDVTGSGKCEVSTEVFTDIAACESITCEMNFTALNQSDCDSFIPDGGCRWKNPGCFDKSVPCNQYIGTQTECELFIGNKVKCYRDQSTSGACRDRQCADKQTAVDDADCVAFLGDCIFNGVGCVHKSAACTAFKGTNETCKNFKAVNTTKQCWGLSATQDSCVDRLCNHLQGVSDSVCKTHFYDNSNCITDGTGCVLGPKQCSDFKGNDETCSKLTASDGPCKASSISSSSEPCTPRVCSEAPNTYNTNQLCQDYHPSCKFYQGKCSAQMNCNDYSSESDCSISSTCLWTYSCKTQIQNYNCEDYETALATHEQCMQRSNNKCTTSGAGCVTYGICASYSQPLMCASAQTIETTKKCTWDNGQCRQLKCQDLKGISDNECNTQLNGCKSNGNSCIDSINNVVVNDIPINDGSINDVPTNDVPTNDVPTNDVSINDCSVFNGSQKLCLIDGYGQPCLYVNGTCYSYDNCTDITKPTQQLCQQFSSQCVVGSKTCVALNQCSEYDKISCIIGINNTKCGWLPTNKCAEFKQCSDATGKTWAECALWNNSCVSDGTTCVPIGDCSSYLTQLSCKDNRDINNYQCIWTLDACRLKQCSDVIAKTDTQCSTNIFKEGQCTTNEASCTVGSDGIPCVFAYAVGQITGVKSCRPKDCTDIMGTNNSQCKGKINNKQCVSDGKTCINQGTCSSYKNNISCTGGGSDYSKCVFSAVSTATDPSVGICQAFSSCAMASGDSTTCVLNKSCKYIQSTKKCEKYDCATFNPHQDKCNPIPSFDGTSYTICMMIDGICKEGDPIMLTQDDCYSTMSHFSYTWNAQTSKCQSCKSSTISSTNGTNVSNDVDSNTNRESIIKIMILVVIVLSV